MKSRKSSSRSSSVPEFPISVRKGSAVVKIYFTPFTKGGQSYPQYTVTYYLGAKRIRDRYADLGKATAEAEAAVIKLANAEHEALKLTSADRSIYVQCQDTLRPLGVSLAAAVTEYASAVAKLPSGATLIEAVTEFAKRHPSGMLQKSVSEVVVELVADARARKLSPEHIRDLDKRLTRFAEFFAMPISEVTPADLRSWIRGLNSKEGRPLTNRSRFNFQRMVVSLFHFARRQRYITRELADELANLEAPKPEATVTEVFTPAEMGQILGVADDDIIPALAIAAFAGLRTKEIHRLTWESVKLGQGVIVVEAEKAKTASRRVVPILHNLADWLGPRVKESGRVSVSPTDRAMNHRFARAAKKVGIAWRHNALRHSFISYRLAVTHDPSRVATEAGNSPNMVHKHYKALVTEADGKAWFDLRPATPANVIPLPSPTGDNAIRLVASP